MMDFEIKITKDAGEIEEAQRLRFEVFNLEMKKGLKLSYRHGLDADDYDPLCDHLIVRDLSSRHVVGTYRLLLGSKARRHFGFYSEREFNLDNIKKLKGEMLELGRTCAHKDYRDKALIPMMWAAIASYVKDHKVRYIFGCASLLTTHPREVSDSFAHLKRKYYAPEECRVQPIACRAFRGLDDHARTREDPSAFLRLPSLIKGYLRVGARLCGPPALDVEFGTTDLFLLLDIKNISSEYLDRFSFLRTRVRHAAG